MSESSIIIGLLQNVAMLLAFSMLYDYWWADDEKFKNLFVKILVGVILGGIGVVLMLTPWTLYTGLVFDTRSIMLSVSGLFFGSIPTIIAMLVTGTYRFIMGGDGMLMGIAVILSSGTIGILWRKLRPSREKKNNLAELFAMGLLVHIIMLICTVFLPAEKAWQTFKTIALPVIIIYPLGTMLLGFLMLSRTKHWFTRKALKESEKRFRSYVDSAPFGVFVADNKGNYTDVNTAAALITGYSKTELLSMNLIELIPSDGRDAAGKHFQKVVKTGQSSGELSFIKKNGSLCYWLVDAVKLSDNRFLGFVTDITDRKQFEEKLLKLSRTVEISPFAIVIADLEGKIEYVNKELLITGGFEDDSKIIGQPIFMFSNEEGIKRLQQEIIPALLSGKQWRGEVMVKRKDGSIFPAEMNCSVILDENGKPKNLLSYYSNITERKQAEQELAKYRKNLENVVQERTKELEIKNTKVTESQQALAFLLEDMNESSEKLRISNEQLELANKEMEAFSYSVSHDLRAPLRAIDGFTRILMDDYVTNFDAEGKRIGSIIQLNARKMGQLIDDLLAFSRVGRTSLSSSEIDMKNMVNAVYHETTTSEDRKRVKFTIGDLTKVEGDTNMMRHVWMNLISNAIKFSAHRKQVLISVSCQIEENKLTYCIKDNGAGFNMKYKDKLFGVFQRLHSEKEFEGTGVGLALVQRIINRHGGEVWANGEVDKGATFYFSLPKKKLKS